MLHCNIGAHAVHEGNFAYALCPAPYVVEREVAFSSNEPFQFSETKTVRSVMCISACMIDM